MIRTVVAIERDGLDIRTLTLQFDVPSEDFDLITAVRKAATDYCKTEQGRRIFDYNCSCFNWADFDTAVPQEFCERYGFKKLNTVLSDIVVDLDEQLVDEFELEEDNS